MENDFLFMYHILCFYFFFSFLCSYYKILFVTGSPLHAKKQVEKEAGAFEQTFLVFRFGIGWHYTARRFVISFSFYKFTTHDLMNITLLYFIIPFYNFISIVTFILF